MRVVELSAFVAAPLAGVTLAALGADVIRIDPPSGGADFHRWPTYVGHSLYWMGLNQGKRSVTLDTRTAEGRDKAVRIITAPGEGAGMLVTNLPVGSWNSYAELKKHREDMIMVVISGNRDGSPAVDYTVNAALGFPMVTGPEGASGPVNHVLPAWDAMTGFLTVAALLAAERHRRQTGEGQLVEISLSDVGLAVAAHLGFIAEAELIAEPRGRFGNHLYGALGRDFATTDGNRVMVVALTRRHWHSLLEATDLGEEFADVAVELGYDFEDEGDRWRGRQQIGARLEAWCGTRTLAEIGATFDRHGVLWGPYQTFKQLLVDDSRASAANPLFAVVSHPLIGELLTAGSPVRFSGTDTVPPKPAPSLGEHTDQILAELGTGGI